MAERKVLNKYIPPDFDPDKLMESKKLLKKIEKRKNKNKNKNKLINIRMMYPFTLKCSKCKCFTYVGTKFNSRVEKLKDENYLNIPIWKFYGKCQDCKNEIIFKTDPKNGDYLLISGGTRTYDANKEQEIADEFYRSSNIVGEDKVKNTEKESYNALLELKRNEQLEELQNINRRNIDKFNSINKALSHLYEKNEKENNKNNFYMNFVDEEDERAFFNLLKKSRTYKDENYHGENKNQEIIYNAHEGENNKVIIEEEIEEEIEDKIEDKILKDTLINKKEENLEILEQVEKNELLFKKSIHNNSYDKESNKNNKVDNKIIIECNKNNFNFNNRLHINNNISDIKSKQMFKEKNITTHCNFIIKKKEDISSIFNDYNSENTDELEN